jgi:hypothetical protein
VARELPEQPGHACFFLARYHGLPAGIVALIRTTRAIAGGHAYWHIMPFLNTT